MALEHELETFERELPRLLSESPGKYALIKGNEVAGVWSTYEDAIQDGYSRFDLEPFLVKQIQPIDRVLRFTRNINPVCQSSTSN
jgi:hypothetical protein